MLYYASLSACFPNSFAGRPKRFENRESELRDQLYPMLRLSAPKPSLESLKSDAEQFIAVWVQPRSDCEQAYLDAFARDDYRLGLIFGDADMASAAEANPEALWKLQNLIKMQAD